MRPGFRYITRGCEPHDLDYIDTNKPLVATATKLSLSLRSGLSSVAVPQL
jgi:hypothetical protein